MTFGRCLGFTAVLAASVLLLAHSAAAMGGKGGGAAVVIDSVQFFDLRGGKTNVEILGGGFTNGSFPVVALDGVIELQVLEYSTTSISANVSASTADGDYTLMISTGSLSKNNAATAHPPGWHDLHRLHRLVSDHRPRQPHPRRRLPTG